eukprot:TRINITY_DN66130_c1_g4_i1.p1 TRINITY_DN66130_c1_g4~~TRINITY_DN66130_c1_g4_i1.p1  ORF type:complete len:719 (-),score=395.26 TRINITY_DN66130_c1_g4_i1:73-2109(-)
MIVAMDRGLGQVTVVNPESEDGRRKTKTFTYDCVFPPDSRQERIYEETVRALVDSVLDGYNGTIFAYGQTGTGKTYTMEGVDDPVNKGVIPRAFEHIFAHIEKSEMQKYLVSASFVEIYQDRVQDLLAAKKETLEVKEHPETGVYVKDLITEVVGGVDDLHSLLMRGKKHRQVACTNMNRDSSRSHCIFTVRVECSDLGPDGEQRIRLGKLNMVDLAGSERQSKTAAVGMRLKEAAKINLSLAALGNVISALTSNRATHIPYRDSKLTRLLQDSLGGNTKTTMIANIGPADWNYGETISTLRFANRAKNIQNKPRVNEDPKDALLRQLQEQIQALRKQLEEDDGVPLTPEQMAFLANPTQEGAMTMMMASPTARARQTQKVVVDKIVHKVVEQGVSKDHFEELKLQAESEKQRLADELAREKERVLQEKAQLEAKSSTLIQKIQEKEQVLNKRRQDRMALREKLQDVENKLLVGKQLLDKAQKQEILLSQKKAELHRQRMEAERVQRLLRQREDQQLSLAEKYETQEERVEKMNRKLQQLRNKFQEQKQEIEDIRADNQREREEMLETIREMTKLIQLKELIALHFVPMEEHEKIKARAVWDDESNDWMLQPLAFEDDELRRPKARPDSRRPTTEFARLQNAMGDESSRFRTRDVLDLQLDEPEQLTQSYDEVALMHH